MSKLKYQETFAAELTESWINGNHSYVRITIRNLKNKAQASFIASAVCENLCNLHDDFFAAGRFVSFMHPNNA